jgi:hypothetical protein
MKLFVHNLPPSTQEGELQALFSHYGTVTNVTLIKSEAHLDSCGVLDLIGAVLPANKIAEQLSRTVWKNRQLDVYEAAMLVDRARLQTSGQATSTVS